MYDRVVFVAGTQYNLLQVIYYVYSVKWMSKVHKVLFYQELDIDYDDSFVYSIFDEVIKIPYFKKYSVFEQVLLRINFCGRNLPFCKVTKIINKNSCNNLVLIFNDGEPITNRIINRYYNVNLNYICLLEDGTGLYTVNTNKKNNWRSLIKRLLFGVKNFPYIGYTHKYNAVFAKYPVKVPIIKTKNKKLIRRCNFYLDYDYVTYLRCLFNIKELLVLHKKRKRILLLNSPWNERGLDETVELKLLRDIVISTEKDYEFIIKLHPRENKNKYISLANFESVTILNQDKFKAIPSDLIILDINPDVILTIGSTAGLDALELGVRSKVVFIYNCFKALRCLDNDFKKFSGENIYFPNTIEKVLHIIYDKAYKETNSIEKVIDRCDVSYLESMVKNES